MNDTNNNAVNEANANNTNINQEQSVPVTPQEDIQNPSQTQPTQTQLTQETAQSVSDEPKETPNAQDAQTGEKEVIDDGGKIEFPYGVTFIGIILIIICLLYYFLYITPTRVLDEAIEDIFDQIKSVSNGISNPKNDTAKFDLNGKLRTAGREHEGVKDIAFLDNLIVNASIEADLKNLDFGATITSDSKDTTDMKYPYDIDLGLDYIDNKFYIETASKVVKYTSSNNIENKLSINANRITDAVAILDEMKNEVINFVSDEKLSRKITTKKVTNQSALTIKAHVKFDNSEIAEIYYDGFKDLLKNKDFIKKWANVFALDEQGATEMLQNIYDKKVTTNNIEVNLYMNLANTDLVALDITVDNIYFEINSLNGFYYIDFKYKDKSNNEVLDIELNYDVSRGILEGVGTLNTSMNVNGLKISTGYLVVEFVYTRITEDETNKMIGNTLDFKFYDDDNGKPFCTLECTLDITYDEELNIANTQEAIELIELNDVELKGLLDTSNKIVYEILFLVKKLGLNKIENIATKQLEVIEKNINNTIEKEVVESIKAYLSNMPKEKLNALLNSPQGQNDLIKKISLLEKENQNDLMLFISTLKGTNALNE